jgi:hypothetical protein
MDSRTCSARTARAHEHTSYAGGITLSQHSRNERDLTKREIYVQGFAKTRKCIFLYSGEIQKCAVRL